MLKNLENDTFLQKIMIEGFSKNKEKKLNEKNFDLDNIRRKRRYSKKEKSEMKEVVRLEDEEQGLEAGNRAKVEGVDVWKSMEKPREAVILNTNDDELDSTELISLENNGKPSHLKPDFNIISSPSTSSSTFISKKDLKSSIIDELDLILSDQITHLTKESSLQIIPIDLKDNIESKVQELNLPSNEKIDLGIFKS